MMNRALLQRQMFANGGAAVPNQFKGFSKLPEEVQMKMNPQLAQKYEEGGDVTQGFDPANPYNIAKFFRDNPGTTVSDYNSYFGTNLDPKEFAIFEKPKPMEEGGVAGLMSQPDMAAMPMGSTQEAVDPAVLETALQGASEEVGDLEQAGDFKSMMDQFSGENKSEEERRDDLASIVGPEDAAQTPDSVLALVTPVVQISMLDQGIAPMAQEAMDTPVEGDMAGGIMSMTGAGNEPPVNFNQGGEVLRRGDEDPVKFFENGGTAGITPMTDFNLDLGADIAKLQPVFAKYMKGTDPEVRKRNLQSDILFDIANTALAFAAPMQGEKAGLSPAQRLAMATQQTQLLPKIQQRTAKSLAEAKAEEKAPLTAAINTATQLGLKKLEQTGKERLNVFDSATQLLKQSRDLTSKKTLQEDAQAHDINLQKSKFGLQSLLDKINKSLDFGYDTKLADQKLEAEKALKAVQAKIDENQIEIKHQNLVKIENQKLAGNKELQEIKDIASMARTNANNTTKIGIAASNNQTKQEIATENNNVKKIIADNKLKLDRERLSFNKLQEENKVNQLSISNSLNADKFNLDVQKLEAEKLRNFLANERAKEEGFRDARRIRLSEKRLKDIDEATLQFNKFKFLSGNELEKAKFEFNKKQEANKVSYQNEQLIVSQRLAGIKATLAALEQSKFTFEKQAADLDKFGKTLDARTLSYISSQSILNSYAKGENNQTSNEINALVTQYISPTPRWDEATKSFVMKTNKLPQEFLNSVKERSQISGATLPTGLEEVETGDKKDDKKTDADDRLVVKNFMNTGQSVKLTDTSIPKLPIDLEKTGATGSGDYLFNVVNLALETIGVGQPFKGTARSKKQLDAINVDLVNVILGDRTGKSAKDERDEIRRILPDVSKFIGGDETAAGKVAQVINFIDRKLETEITGLNQLVLSKGDFTDSASKVLRLKQLKAGYQQFLDAYNLQKGGGGDKPPLSSFRKSN
jgi:hypothetical protein